MLPRSIRGRITALTVVVSLASIAVLLGVSFLSIEQIFRQMAHRSLSERLDEAMPLIAEGEYHLAIDRVGSDLVVITAADGTVIDATPNAAGLTSVRTGDDADGDVEDEVDDLFLDGREDDDRDDMDDDEHGDESRSPAATQTGTGTAPAGPVARTDGDDDDDRDDDGDDDAEPDKAAHAVSTPGAGRLSADEDGDYDEDDSDDGDDDYPARPPAPTYTPVYRVDDDDWDDDDDDWDDAAWRGTGVPYLRASLSVRRGSPVAADLAPVRLDIADGADGTAAQGGRHLIGRAYAQGRTAADDGGRAGDTGSGDADGGESAAAEERAAMCNHVAGKDGDHAAAEPFDVSPAASIAVSELVDVEGPYVVMQRRADSPDGTVTVIAISPLAPVLAMARRAAQVLLPVFAVLFAGSVAITRMVLNGALRPVERMRREVEQISAEGVGGRLHVPAYDRDLAPLAETFNDLLEQVDRMIGDQRRFMSDASHELKSPLAATGIILETLNASPDVPVDHAAIEDLLRENEHATDIVGNLLLLARQDEGRMLPVKRPVDLADLLLEEVAALTVYDQVDFDVAGVEPLVVQADRGYLAQAVRNVLVNAVRYAKERVAVSCAVSGGTVRITVSDDGVGIAPEDRERAFGRFAKLGEEPRRGQKGTGLGLAVARGVMAAQGGTVFFADSQLGGATAAIELPLD